MENKKDIGKAINDKLSSLDKTPREQVWSGISYELQKRKKRRAGFFFFWTKILGIMLVGGMLAFFLYYQSSGFNRNIPDDAKDSIIINTGNGETITITPNKNPGDTKLETVNEKENSNQDINGAKEGNIISNTNNSNGKNSYELQDDVTYKNKNAKANDHKNGFKVVSSRSSKAKKHLESKNHVGKLTGKGSKNSKLQSNLGISGNLVSASEKDNRDSAKSDLTTQIKNDSLSIDLSSLESKKSVNKNPDVRITKKDSLIAQRQKEKELKLKLRDSLIAQKQKEQDLKTKAKDSLIALKQKDKEININMYPEDSLKQDTGKKYHKLYIDAFISPTLYGYFANRSTLDRRLDSLPKKTELKYSYGFGLTYDLTQRISMRIGYRKINLIYITSNAPVNTTNYRGIAYNPNLSNGTLYAISNFSERMDITQRISYTEIPLEIKYLILNKNLGIKSSFGFSYLLLNENKINIVALNGFDMAIGKTKNLSDTSVSVNLGIELDYPIFDNTKLFIEPILNYQIKAFADDDYKPYIFGIHAGIRYSLNNK